MIKNSGNRLQAAGYTLCIGTKFEVRNTKYEVGDSKFLFLTSCFKCVQREASLWIKTPANTSLFLACLLSWRV